MNELTAPDVRLKLVNMVNFMLYVFYHNSEKVSRRASWCCRSAFGCRHLGGVGAARWFLGTSASDRVEQSGKRRKWN